MGQTVAKKIDKPNKFAGPCALCGARVAAGAGTLGKDEADKWVTLHRDGECGEVEAPKAVDTKKLAPTPEQAEAQALFDTGESMVIEAGAGTGKTSTLKMLAESTTRRGQYLAFNKAIVVEAAEKFPKNVACNTAHSLAFQAIGKQYRHRLDAPRMSSDQIARVLHIDPIKVRVGDAGHRTLAAGFLAGRVMQAVTKFCQSADAEPERRHFPYIEGIDLPTPDGRRTFANNDEIATALLPVAKRAWADLNSTTGSLRFGHDHYLKIWQLNNPVINADFILFDEAQDANPVMAAIVAAQTHAQVVYVGDSQQAIYEFTGAVNTLGRLDSDHRVFLTQSFRFGPALADLANVVLERLEAELRLVGTPTIPTTIGLVQREDAILCRTNAHAMSTVLQLLEQGRRPHLVGGGSEIVSFAKAARDLQNGGHTSHPELACFDSWNAVQEYVAVDAQGGDLRLLVKLVDEFGVAKILQALDGMPSERQADVVVSTAHKAKGREWDAVRLGSDFNVEDDISVSEMRLLYVAVTRARLQLDMTAVEKFFNPEADVAAETPAADLDDDVTRWVDGIED